jgi:hypothetical protein
VANKAELRERVGRNLGDPRHSRFPTQKVNSKLVEGYTIASLLTGAIQKSVALPFPSDTPYINLRELVPDYFAVIGLYNLKTNSWIPAVSQKQLDNLRWDWERWTGDPVSGFFIVDFSRICIVPYQPVATGMFVLWYWAYPTVFDESMEPILPVSHQHILADYATGELQDEQKEWIKSEVYLSSFYSVIPEVEKQVNNIANNDKIVVMQPYSFLPMYGKGGTGSVPNFADNIVPSGVIDGVNAVFNLPSNPNPTATLCLTKNGQVLYQNVGYTLNGNVITFVNDYIPSPGDLLRAWYRQD